MYDYDVPLTLGSAIKLLEEVPPETRILGGELCSFRGYYDELAISLSHPISEVGDMLSTLKNAINQEFNGYKGGIFTMSELDVDYTGKEVKKRNHTCPECEAPATFHEELHLDRSPGYRYNSEEVENLKRMLEKYKKLVPEAYADGYSSGNGGSVEGSFNSWMWSTTRETFNELNEK